MIVSSFLSHTDTVIYHLKSRHEREGSHRWDFKEHVIKELSTKEWTETKETIKGCRSTHILSIPKSERHYQFSARRSKEKK